MAAATTSDFQVQGIARSEAVPGARSRRHQTTPEAGHALELLGHAIEYLSDEFVHEGQAVRCDDPYVEAIQLLMGLNRQIYYECPVVPTLAERMRTFFHFTLPKGDQ